MKIITNLLTTDHSRSAESCVAESQIHALIAKQKDIIQVTQVAVSIACMKCI